MKSALFCRYGGIGDCLLLTSVAKVLKDRGYEVDYAVGNPAFPIHELFENLDLFRNVFPARRIMNIGDEFIEDSAGNWISTNVAKKNYDLPIDFKFSVELNSMYQAMSGMKLEWRWLAHQNSNYQNWFDLSLAWCGIDPLSVPDEDKRPIYKIKDDELEWAKSVLLSGSPIIGMQTNASSLVRTWYRSDELPHILAEKYKDGTILFYRDNNWYMRKGSRVGKIDFPQGKNPVRCSAALISLMDLFVAADSGMAHIAEAIGTKCIVIYMTVPYWTRSKYYKHTIPIEPKVDCHPCFDLNRYCWKVESTIEEALSEREKKLFDFSKKGKKIEDVAKELNTNEEGVNREFDALQRRIEALKCRQPDCSASINNELIMEQIEQCLTTK